MTCVRPSFIFILFVISFASQAQTEKFIGKSEEFILENVKGYSSVEARMIEHEEFNVLVFEADKRELSFYFTFYRGAKVCNFIKNRGPFSVLREEIENIKANFHKTGNNDWENSAKTVNVKFDDSGGQNVLVFSQIRN